jgi:2-dehydropantoate 2-reductase
MSDEKVTRYVIVGAGAIGAAIGGLLNRAGLNVICVARPAVAEALARGIVIDEHGEQTTITADAVTGVSELTPQAGDVVFITTKSQATAEAAEEVLRTYDDTLPVVCLQNGVRNEAIVARLFKTVYAGLVFFSAVQLEPSVISLPQGRTVAIGCYPEGLDDRAGQICAELTQAGLQVLCSPHVMAMKWGKLIANLNNATTTITGYWLERAMADEDMRKLMLAVREEGLRVADTAGIAVEPPADQPSPIRIRQMTSKLRQPPKADDASNLADAERTYSSMWQDLYLGRKENEAEFLNGEIIALGKRLGIPTPYNSTLLEVVNRMFAEGLKPGIYSPNELHAVIRSKVEHPADSDQRPQ